MPDMPKVLMACPTWSGCEYALKSWAAAYFAQTYPNKGALQVDNSDGPMQGGNLHYTHMVRAQGIPVIWQQTRFPYVWDTFELTWTEYIIPYAYEHRYDYILSVEADIVLPPDGMEKMVQAARECSTDRPAFITQRYHPRGQPGPSFWWDTLGCSLFPVGPLYEERHTVCAVWELEVFLILQRHGWQRIRAGHDIPDLFIPEHLRDPQDPIVFKYTGTPADNAYMARVYQSNGLNRDGSVPEAKPVAKMREIPCAP